MFLQYFAAMYVDFVDGKVKGMLQMYKFYAQDMTTSEYRID